MSSIVILTRFDEEKHFGGDIVQSRAITKFLEQNGYKVRRIEIIDNTVTSLDLVIIFNLTRPLEAYLNAKECIRKGIKYIIFPVYWDLDSIKIPKTLNVKRRQYPLLIKDLYRALRNLSKTKYDKSKYIFDFTIYSSFKMCKFILNNAMLVCPNSNAELIHLIDKFKVNVISKIIYNGIQTTIDKVNIPSSILNVLPKDQFILCMGAIGPRKNQLALVRAANRTGINVVIMGGIAPNCESYASLLMNEAKSNVIFLKSQPYSVAIKILEMSKGHIQPSFIETPGLASLEAASLGIPIVVSDVPPVKEYFSDFALYCNPFDVDSICSSLEKLISLSYDDNMKLKADAKAYFTSTYSWENALAPLLDLLEEFK